ncbi:MAG: hypothetical protein JO104_03555 [Candidatus Eremiobacteraeota bacterium]|nr:hypothetical protein [Candidatus Eremiobacteraeota bacterium]
MAGRRSRAKGTIELIVRVAPVVAVGVLCHALAFIVWDVGSRPPGKLIADLGAGFKSPRMLVKGVWRLAVGWLVLLIGALLILSVTVDQIRTEFSVLESGAIVAGLLIEALVGDPVRAQMLRRGES